MIEQFTSGTPQVSQPAAGALRDRHSKGEKDDQSDSFEDVVSKAGERHAQTSKKNRDGDKPADKDGIDLRRPVDVLPKAALDLSAALRGFPNSSHANAPKANLSQANFSQANSSQAHSHQTNTSHANSPQINSSQTKTPQTNSSQADSSQANSFRVNLSQVSLPRSDSSRTDLPQVTASQVTASLVNPLQADPAQALGKLADVQDVLKSIDKADQTERQAEVALEKLVEKIKQAASAEKPDADDVQLNDQFDDQQSLTPSDELGLLLGLTKDVDSKSGKKAISADAVDRSDEKADDENRGADKLDSKIDARGADPMLITVDARRGGDEPASDKDSSSSRGDMVRVGSANGRGRSVDIDIPAVPGTQQQDGAKAATTPKIETATVLEARRYLGFTTETNGTALAAAVKADPAWTGALHAAQRADISTLANTVTEVNTLKLEMNPEHLGSMVASLKLKGEELTVELRVNSVEAYHHLTADHDDIVKSLQDQGFSIDKVTVQLNATDRTDTGADRDTGRQGQRDGQTDQKAAQREGQGGQPGRNDGQREPQRRWTTSGEIADGASADGRSDPGRSGNLYL